MEVRPGEAQAESADDERQTPPGGTTVEPTVEPVPVSVHAPVQSGRGRLVWMSAVGAAALVVIAGALLITNTVGRPLIATEYEISGTSLVALTADGRTAWSHDFGWPPTVLMYNRTAHAMFASADLDGDGHQELLAVLHAPPGNGQTSNDTIFCFTDTGALKWSYTPNHKLTFEGQTYDGPWRHYALLASDGPGRQHVWAAFGHHTWWPSFVVELDASGKATTRYFQSGAIYALAYWLTNSGAYLAASGVDNEYGRAALAVLRVDAPPATSPQHAATGFHCDDCPSQGPDFFALLPRTELSLLSGDAYNYGGGLTVLGNDLKLGTGESGTGGALYYLRDDFTFHDSALNDSYWSDHRKLETSGQLHHKAVDCPDLRASHDARTWTPTSEWQHVPLAFAAAADGSPDRPVAGCETTSLTTFT